jgi:hypothetical protein
MLMYVDPGLLRDLDAGPPRDVDAALPREVDAAQVLHDPSIGEALH